MLEEMYTSECCNADFHKNTAALITKIKPAGLRRQLDKIVNGLGAIGNAAGVGALTDPVVAAGDSIDGQSTSGAAALGAEIGDVEDSVLEGAGMAVP